MFASIQIQPTIVNQIKARQQQNPQYESLKQKVAGEETDWSVDDAETLKYKGKLWVPEELRKEVMKQAHKSLYIMHPRAIKMYQDLKKIYWWQRMKRDISDYVIKCLTCQQVKAEH